MLEHFGQHLRQPQPSSQSSSSSSAFSRPEAISVNIFAAILSAMRSLADAKSKLGQDDIKKAAAAIILGMLLKTVFSVKMLIVIGAALLGFVVDTLDLAIEVVRMLSKLTMSI